MSDGTSTAGLGPWWVVVTGASQGLGAAICTCLAPLLPPGSKLLGMARSQQGLDSTVASVKAINPQVTVSELLTSEVTSRSRTMVEPPKLLGLIEERI